MSGRRRKQLERLASKPKDLTWAELRSVLLGLGFIEHESKGGSGVCFRHGEHGHQVIHLHKPHGRNPPTVLVCYVRRVVERLEEWGHL